MFVLILIKLLLLILSSEKKFTKLVKLLLLPKTPIVQRDVASSGVNLNSDEIQNLPVVNIASAVGLQAGVIGEEIRGSGSEDEIIYQVNGVTMRDGRDNTPYSNISFTSVEQIKLQTGGFTADVGEVRSGLVEVVTKEGSTDKYSFSFYSQLRPAGNKHFGQSVNDPNSYFLRPYLDPAVCGLVQKTVHGMNIQNDNIRNLKDGMHFHKQHFKMIIQMMT